MVHDHFRTVLVNVGDLPGFTGIRIRIFLKQNIQRKTVNLIRHGFDFLRVRIVPGVAVGFREMPNQDLCYIRG